MQAQRVLALEETRKLRGSQVRQSEEEEQVRQE
jgi:hypothetical protein